VVARERAPGDRRLVAYVVRREPPGPTPAELRQHLRQTLPDYMVPSAFVFLEALPVSPNGKVDRSALPEPDSTPGDPGSLRIAPRNATELQLQKIWEEVLQLRPIGVTDSFFELGGHSLLAVRLAAQIEKRLHQRLPVATLFQSPTVRQLAELLGDTEAAVMPASTSIVEIQPRGSRPPLFLVHGVGGGMFWGYTNLARHLGPHQPVYAFKSRGLDGRPEFDSIEAMAAAYVADLRAFQPHGPYHVGGYCFGGNVAFEMARQLRAQGERLALLALMNCAPPNSSYTRIRWNVRFVGQLLRNLGRWVADFIHWDARKQREFLGWQLRTLRRKAGRVLASSAGAAPPVHLEEVVDLSAYSELQRQLWATHLQALFQYQPRPFDGHVTLYRSRTHPLLCSFDPQCGWGELAREGVTVRVVPGAHESILEEPHVRGVAGELENSLQALQRAAHETPPS
jgi:thioesterase domain-containing protein/acyl carrier protein